MEKHEIREHWTNWATTYGGELRATTKTWTVKALEIDALTRRLSRVLPRTDSCRVLEMGCGNGVNCIALAKDFPSVHFDGVDFIPEMVASGNERVRGEGLAGQVQLLVGDVLAAGSIDGLQKQYDAVFTDRCLINLNTLELQQKAISNLAELVRPGGHLLMIENSATTYAQQNRCREMLGLPPRTPAEFNLFFDEAGILGHLGASGLELVDVEDFLSLHDLMLYVLVPAINGGKVDYEHPLVEAATRLNQEMSASTQSAFGPFGQNRMFVCRKPA